MKKTISALFAGVLLLAGCAKELDNTTGKRGMIFTASIEDAKTGITEGGKVSWLENDVISVNGIRFVVDAIDPANPGRADFVKENAGDPDPEPVEGEYRAYYPAGLYDGVSATLPEIQTFSSDSDISGINPMYAGSVDTKLSFHNVCGMLELIISGEGSVCSIEVSDAVSGLSGGFTIENNTAVLTADALKDAADVTLDCGKGVALGQDKAFYVALPKGEYSALGIKIYDDKGKVSTLKLKSGVTAKIERNTIYPIHMNADFQVPEPLTGVFSVAAGKQVRFAQGNLFRGNGFWAVENAQYKTWTSWDENHVSLFTWTDADNCGAGENYTASNISSLDWGKAFCEEHGLGEGTWKVLGSSEWKYLLELRKMQVENTPRFTNTVAEAVIIGGIECRGLFIYPDNYDGTVVDGSFSWKKIKNEGIVFLPAAGHRESSTISAANCGYYWTANPLGSTMAYNLRFSADNTTVYNAFGRYMGYSVRLVSPCN